MYVVELLLTLNINLSMKQSGWFLLNKRFSNQLTGGCWVCDGGSTKNFLVVWMENTNIC